jgi:predicted nucleic acid-binding protein
MLAWLRDEPAASRVDEILQQAADGDLQLSMSWINAGEAYYMLVRKHSQQAADEFLRRLPALPIRLVLPDEEAVIEAARLKSTRRLSHADSFAAALARHEKSVLVTGDPELREMVDILAVEWIGGARDPHK